MNNFQYGVELLSWHVGFSRSGLNVMYTIFGFVRC